MTYNATNEYLQLLHELEAYHVPKIILDSLSSYMKTIHQSDVEKRFSAPMLWIGLYIAFASLVCILLMLIDLVHGVRSRKLWFPCNYFRINAFSLTVISVAMKLPLDLTGMMPGVVDQLAKTGSMAFMCIIMANLLPSLVAMEENDLYSNMAALSVLVINVVVNVCIQIKTGVVFTSTELNVPKAYPMLAFIYIILLLKLLVLFVCSCIPSLTYSKDLDLQYSNFHSEASREIQRSSRTILTSKRLVEYVKKHWIMARSGGSQFTQFVFTAHLQTTCACGVICVFVSILHILTIIWSFEAIIDKDYGSDYSWSMMVIVMVQPIGVVVGTIAPLCRCFAPFISFYDSPNYLNVFQVEGYWTSKLYVWRGTSTGLPSYIEMVIQPLKLLILTLCIRFQVAVVVVCKIIALSLYYFSVCPLYFFHRFKWLLNVSSSDGERTDNLTQEEIFFVDAHAMKFGNELGLSNRTREDLLKSGKRWIQEGEDNQPYIDLLEQSISDNFRGVGRLRYSQVRYAMDFGNYWSLEVVTLATVACSLPEIKKEEVDGLKRSVKECLEYVMIVEESFPHSSHYFLMAVKVLWEEVCVNHKWIGNRLPQLNTAREVVEWFKNTADGTSFRTTNLFAKVKDEDHRQAFKVSMRWISSGILDSNSWDDDDVLANQQKIFNSLSAIIADTIAACLTNLPQVIVNKCNPNVAEEREASVKGAALLLGETKLIIEKLQELDLPNINPSDMPSLNKWWKSLRDVC